MENGLSGVEDDQTLSSLLVHDSVATLATTYSVLRSDLVLTDNRIELKTILLEVCMYINYKVIFFNNIWKEVQVNIYWLFATYNTCFLQLVKLAHKSIGRVISTLCIIWPDPLQEPLIRIRVAKNTVINSHKINQNYKNIIFFKEIPYFV